MHKNTKFRKATTTGSKVSNPIKGIKNAKEFSFTYLLS